MKIAHVITGLSTGGAEMMLYKLLAAFRTDGPEAEVISLAPPGSLAPRIEALGVPVASPRMPQGPGALVRFGRLARLVARSRADAVHCWMYHANLLGGLATRTAGAGPVLWGLRQSTLDPARSKPATIRVARLGARLSRTVPARILCVSESARRVHAAMGYDEARMVVIPNGFDLASFRPDEAARAAVRAELGLPETAPLVGLIARLDAQKDHATFLHAAAHAAASHPGAAFLLAGEGTEADSPAVAAMVREAGLEGRVHALGARDDVARLTAALDLAVSSSAFGEGFSNAVGEALACGVPAVVTDVGDSAAIVGDEGRAVPPGDAAALGAAISEMLALPAAERRRLGEAARARMARDYGIAAIAARYGDVYDAVVRG